MFERRNQHLGVEERCVECDVGAVQAAIEKAGLPERTGSRLVSGR